MMPNADEKSIGYVPAKESVVAEGAESADHEKELGTADYYVDPKFEKKIIRKIDASTWEACPQYSGSSFQLLLICLKTS